MNKRKIFLHSLNRFRMAGAVIAVMLFAACDDEETMGVRSNGDTICFNPMQQTDEWNELPQSRSTGNAHSEDAQSADTTYVVKLDCETPDGKPLYLHVQVTDGIECAGTEAMTEDVPATRGVQVTGADNFHDTFGMYAVSYEQWNPTQDYNLMRNLKVEKRSNWQTDIKWPTKGRVDFYAYAPHSDATGRNFNITYSKHTTEEGPIFHVRQTDAISPSESPDLMFASPGGFNAGNGGNAVRLNFKHVLSAIKIRTHQTEFFKGRLESLKILNACRDADFHLKPSAITISNRGNRGPITLVQNGTANIDKDQELISHGGAFFMIPQAINNNNPVELEIRFAPEGKPAQTTKIKLSAPDGGWWYQSRTYTYTLSNSESTPNPEWDYIFEVENVGGVYNLDFNNRDQSISVQSYTYPKGEPNNKKAVDWNYEYSIDDGVTWLQPENGSFTNILNIFEGHKNAPLSSDGTNHSLNVRVAYPDERGWENLEDIELRNQLPNGTESYPYDLSTDGGKILTTTANCYIVNKPGWYSFPMVFGNAIKNGQINSSAFLCTLQGTNYVMRNLVNSKGTPINNPYVYNQNLHISNAGLLWQDSPNLVKQIQFHNGTHIKFYVDGNTIKQGNAVICAFYNGEVAWSWHIWVTPYGLTQKVNDFGNPLSDITLYDNANGAYQAMGMPIGHCTGDSKIYQRRSIKLRFMSKVGDEKIITLQRQEFRERRPGNTPLYQWGRTTPIPAGIYKESMNHRDPCPFKDLYWGDNISNKSIKSRAISVGTDQSIIYPHELWANELKGQSYWHSDQVRNRWDNDPSLNGSIQSGKVKKTIYDPSPRGYAVPRARVFEQFLTEGFSEIQYTTLKYWNAQVYSKDSYVKEYGARFRVRRGAYDWQTIFMPSTGFLNGSAMVDWGQPTIFDVALTGVYWTAECENDTRRVRALHFGFREVDPFICVRYLDGTADCNAILPVKE